MADVSIRADSPVTVKEEPVDGGWVFPKKVVSTYIVNPVFVNNIPKSINWFDMLENDEGDPFGP